MRVRQPFFRPQKNRWYVNIGGKHINLGPDKTEAWAKYHELMAERARKPATPPACEPGTFVVTVLDKYLEWLKMRVDAGSKAQRTYDWYQDYLQSFLLHATPEYAVQSLTVAQLLPIHVYEWTDGNAAWKGSKRGAMIAVQRAFNWAAKAGLLKEIGSSSPIKHLEKPPPGRREKLITQDEYVEALALTHGQEFHDLLQLAWETGARPHELFTVEKSHVDLDNSRWVFPIKESKGKKYQRVVYLTPTALEITRRLCLKTPAGPLCRNTDNVPWTPYAVNCRFRLLRTAIGRKRLQENGHMIPKIPKLKPKERQYPELVAKRREAVLERRAKVRQLANVAGAKLNLYLFRHAFVTRALESGLLDAVTVSVLAGHRDTQVISRVYSHLTQRPHFLREAVKKATSASA